MKFFKLIIICFLTVNLTACNAIEMWQKKSFYEETFKDFLITQDGRQIIPNPNYNSIYELCLFRHKSSKN